MRMPRARFTLRLMMITIVLAGLVFAGMAAKQERQRRLGALQAAEAIYKNAVLSRNVAELAAAEYESGIYKQEDEEIESSIYRAESESKTADEQGIERARSEIERARNQRRMRQKKFAGDMKVLRSEVEKAKAEESVKDADVQRAKASLNKWSWLSILQ